MNCWTQNTRWTNQLLVPWLALLLALLPLGGYIAYTLCQEHGQIEKMERERLATQAKVIDENLARQLEGVYRALVGIRKELPLWGGKDGLALANGRLETMAGAMPGIRTFLITNAAGTVIACNHEQLIGQNISRREYFQAPLKEPNRSTLYVSPPFKTLLGNFVINLGLLIPGPEGEFAGVVSAALDPEYFTILLGSVLYTKDMWSALAHGDGKQFLMVPARQGMAGLDLARPGSFFTLHRESGRQATVLSGIGYATDEGRLMALRTISPGNVPMDKPLVVAVGRNLAALFADWRRDALEEGTMFAVVALTTTLALFFYQRRQRRYEASSARGVEELRQAKEAADAANIAKSRFLVTIAHEFRTPLSLLSCGTDILDRYGDRLTKERQTEQNEQIRSAARQMSNLIDSVISFSRLETDRPQTAPAPLDVGRICRTIAAEVRTVWDNGHEFNIEICADPESAVLEESLFRRVLENLLTNAFRYTPPGGTVSLNVRREGNQLLMVITDTGIGIPAEDQQRIFDSFYRGRNVEARRGLGLGLSIVREALLQIGGTITVTSRVGAGTTMRVEIPVVAEAASEEQHSCTQY